MRNVEKEEKNMNEQQQAYKNKLRLAFGGKK